MENMDNIDYNVPEWFKGQEFSKLNPIQLKQVKDLIDHWNDNLYKVMANRITNDMQDFVLNIFNFLIKCPDITLEDCTFHQIVAEIAYYLPSDKYIQELLDN